MGTVENKRIGFDYVILEEIEAGLELYGFEVKSLRAGQGSLKGARVVARGGEAYLVGATIPHSNPRTLRRITTQKGPAASCLVPRK